MEKIQNLEESYQTQRDPGISHNVYYQTLNGHHSYESENLDKLYAALCQTQSEMEMAKMDSTNPHFRSRYADLNSVVAASRPYLSKNGLCVLQRLSYGNDKSTYLNTRLAHTSGQWIESQVIIKPPKEDIQSMGSYLTYLKRYCYAALVGVVAGEEDDDGEKATVPYRSHDRQPEASTNAVLCNKTQVGLLESEIGDQDWITTKILDGFGIRSLSELPESKFGGVLKRVREMKAAYEKSEKAEKNG